MAAPPKDHSRPEAGGVDPAELQAYFVRAGRYTAGHFDLPMMGTTVALDGVEVIREGVLQNVFD